MKKSRLFRLPAIVAACALMAFMASCAEEDMGMESPQAGDGDEVSVQLSYTVSSISPGTRTVPTDMENDGTNDDGPNIKVLNMWILQFAGNQSGSLLLGAPRFVSADDIAVTPFSLPLVQNSSLCYTLFVANIAAGAQYQWNLSTESTFADVIKRVKTLQAEEDSWETFLPSGKTLLMSAVTESAVTVETILNPVFTRNVAKVTLNLSLDNDDMEILSVRLRNVSNAIVYADAALSKLNVPSVYPSDVVVMDYPAVTSGLPANGQAVLFSWYVPRNRRGTNASSVEAKDKTFYAPQGATYFEIIVKKASTSATSIFRVYPGEDQMSDYNIEPNRHYTVGLTVKDVGTDVADSRVETFADVDYTAIGATSNSFILNPAPAGGGNRVYRIPISQVNRYWKGTYDGYGNDPLRTIGDNDPWKVELIWSDLSPLFGGSGITLRGNNGLGLGEGTGPDQWFELEVPAGLPAGNFTLGIKKKTGGNGVVGEYLWSWHFWVTDYNPGKFNPSVISNGVYTYPVPGGQVERYGTTSNLWGTAYTDKVMMDRNLGAVENFFTTQPANSLQGNLHYQFGRKDPFPTCTIIGTPVAIGAGAVPVKKTISTPNVFYTVSSGNWASDATDTQYQWNDPQANTTAKSIYDPCPPGWRMPANGTWNDFNLNVQADGITTYLNTQNASRDLAWGYGRGIGTAVNPVNGLRYWPGGAGAVTAGRIWFPAAGCRNYSAGSLGSVGSYGYCWSATPGSAANGRYLYFGSGSVNPNNYNSRAIGFSVRCVAE